MLLAVAFYVFLMFSPQTQVVATPQGDNITMESADDDNIVWGTDSSVVSGE